MRQAVVLIAAMLFHLTGAVRPQGPRPESVASAREARMDPRVRNVLLLHSYDPTYEWTNELTRGIVSVLAAQPFETELRVEYMDAKRTRPAQRNELARVLLEKKYRGVSIDLVVTTDDDATVYAMRADSGLPAGVPVVYCGVSSQETLQRAPRERFTGVEEVFRAQDFLLATLKLWPKGKTVAVVTDNSPTGRDQQALYRKLAGEEKGLRFVFLDGAEVAFEDLLMRLRQLPVDSLVVLSAFTRDNQGAFIPQHESGRRISAAARVPVVSPNTSQLGQGILAGNGNGGYEHGRVAGAMAARVLSGEAVPEVGREAQGSLQLVIDDQLARVWGIGAGAYPPNAIVVNRAGGWAQAYEENRSLVWGAVVVFLLQSSITVALILSRNRRRRVEEELRASRANLERAQEIARMGSWEREVATGRLTWSDEVYRLHGLEPGSIQPDTGRFLEMIHPEDRERIRELVQRCDAAKQSRRLEFRVVRADGAVRHMRSFGEWTEEPSGREVVRGVVQDITELREMEEHFRHAQRVESLGNLAGGIAHDFNNLLTIINGYSQILLLRMAPDDPHVGKIREIHRAGDRAAALTRQLLAFSRKQVMSARVLDLNEVIVSAGGMLRPLLGEAIRYETRLAPSLRAIEADPYQVEQVLLNLAANARDAMPAGGALTIETENEDLAGLVSWHDLEVKPGPYVRLRVQDTGHGMDESVRQRVFEPFFTTKDQGKGTGLGLSSVFGIVRQSGGYISVSSEPGRGATFDILLPAVDGVADGKSEAAPELRGGGGRILIVEDEEQIRTLAETTLRELGYRVASAADAGEALAMEFTALGGPPELLIADIVMPGTSGAALAREMGARLEGLKVLLISGYAGREFDRESVPGAGFLAKPFLPAELAERVRGLLGNAKGI